MEYDTEQPLINTLLHWYDHCGRTLPWRVRAPGLPNPYHVWLSEIMLQQTTVATVQSYFHAFLTKWPTLSDLAEATLDEILVAWQGLGYYSRARNLYKCAQILMEEYGGVFPAKRPDLEALPGIGPYTSAAIAAIAFDEPVVPVDGNVIRVLSRLYGIKEPPSKSKALIMQYAEAFSDSPRPGDFAQALMDLGATVCTPKKPNCHMCPWQAECVAYGEGDPGRYPYKEAQAAKPIRYASAFVCLNARGEILLRKRADKGLLAGLYEVPSTTWSVNEEQTKREGMKFLEPHQHQCWKGVVKHTFTHFHFEVNVYQIQTVSSSVGIWVPFADLKDYALPTLMKKIIKIGWG